MGVRQLRVKKMRRHLVIERTVECRNDDIGVFHNLRQSRLPKLPPVARGISGSFFLNQLFTRLQVKDVLQITLKWN